VQHRELSSAQLSKTLLTRSAVRWHGLAGVGVKRNQIRDAIDCYGAGKLLSIPADEKKSFDRPLAQTGGVDSIGIDSILALESFQC
jgi:hypothetical protein